MVSLLKPGLQAANAAAVASTGTAITATSAPRTASAASAPARSMTPSFNAAATCTGSLS